MKMNNSTATSKSTSEGLIDLYTRIPDYSEIQHLGQSDFINTLEKLKEEFRQCRASLYNEEFCSDSEYLAEKSSPSNNGTSRPTDNLYFYSSSKYANTGNKELSTGERCGTLTFDDEGNGKATKINNHNLIASSSATGGAADHINDIESGRWRAGRQCLSITSCELHRPPHRAASASSLIHPSRYLMAEGRSSSQCGKRNINSGRSDGEYHAELTDDDDDDDDDDDRWSLASSISDISISKWSSSPEIYHCRSRSREHLPPSNVQQRLLERKSRNHSAPSVAFKEDPPTRKPAFKANPVPDHVYKPLYEFIMLKNQRRSERIREQSKRRLLAQVKPFSFSKNSTKSASCVNVNNGKVERAPESLNNAKPLKKRRNDVLGNIKTNNNRLNSAGSMTLFKAKPAPPRTRALLAAIRQKEQQEYRELKKRLRAEILLKNASLPPSMAAREKRTKLTNAKIDEVLNDYQKSFRATKGKNRNFREMSTGTDDTGVLTDDDRMSDDDYSGMSASTKKITTVVKPFKFSHRSSRKFTSFGSSRAFEPSSNDNHASRLRYKTAKLKQEEETKRDEENLMRIIAAERRQQKLRDSHLHAWQHACSYSAERDIEMRRQLRLAAAILERETFVRDMSTMLRRVQSSKLLLETDFGKERKKEPCKKHRNEFQSSSRLYYNRTDERNKIKKNHPITRTVSLLDRFGESDTAALAEGTLSNSDNESSSEEEGNSEHALETDAEELLNDENNDVQEEGVKEKVSQSKGEMILKSSGSREENQDHSLKPDMEEHVDDDIDDEVGEEEEENENENEEKDGTTEEIPSVQREQSSFK